MTKTVIETLVDAAQTTLTEQRREFARGDVEDLDRLEDAIAAYRASVEPSAGPRCFVRDCEGAAIINAHEFGGSCESHATMLSEFVRNCIAAQNRT